MAHEVIQSARPELAIMSLLAALFGHAETARRCPLIGKADFPPQGRDFRF